MNGSETLNIPREDIALMKEALENHGLAQWARWIPQLMGQWLDRQASGDSNASSK